MLATSQPAPYTTKTADLSSSIPWSGLCGDQVPFGTVDPMLADSPFVRPSLSAHIILAGESRTGGRQNELSQGQVCSSGSDLMDLACLPTHGLAEDAAAENK